MLNELTVILEDGGDGWWVATIPEIPGAFSQGRTQGEAKENAIDAANELMLARRERALRDKAPGAVSQMIPSGA